MKTETWIRIFDILQKLCAYIIGLALILRGMTDNNDQWLIAVGFYLLVNISEKNE